MLRALGVEPVIGDVTGPRSSLADAMKGIDGLVDSAAIISGTWSTAAPEEFDRVTTRGRSMCWTRRGDKESAGWWSSFPR